MRSPTFSPSPTTTSVVPSGPVAAVQLPLPSLAVHVISPAMAKVETRHSAARSTPSVFPQVCRIGCPFLLQPVRQFDCYALPGALTACSCQPGARLRRPAMRPNCIPPTPTTRVYPSDCLPCACRQDATVGEASRVSHELLIPFAVFLCSTVLDPSRYSEDTPQTLRPPRRRGPGRPASPAGAEHGLGDHED